MTPPFPLLAGDPVVTPERQVRYTYWPVAYQFGDPTVISTVPLPLGGVKFSEVMRGVGEFTASLQLADDSVRALYPWDKIVPKKTGIVVVRGVFDEQAGTWQDTVIQHYTVFEAPTDPHTGRMSIKGFTVEGNWARRLITKAMSWSNVDQLVIAQDLLDPVKFSQIPLGAGMWPGWITVDPPTEFTGVSRTFAYEERQETNLLEAHQNRSQLATNSYEWTTRPIVLVGAGPNEASVYRIQYLMGFPRLGRELGDDWPVPRLVFDRLGRGNVTEFKPVNNASNVVNIVWARGNGYEELQTKALATYPQWTQGFLQAEGRFSDPDVKEVNTLTAYALRQIYQSLSNERYISTLRIKGNQFPFFGSYDIGDQMIMQTNDLTGPPDFYNPSGFVEFLVRVFGWAVTPPQGDQDEEIELVVAGGPSA